MILVIEFFLALVYASFFEWTLHRFVMHKRLSWFEYPFKSHAVVHHQTFKADHTYHLIDEKDKSTIRMAWWNGIVLTILATSISVSVAYSTCRWEILAVVFFVFGAYYCTYEYFHWCMHLPKQRRFETSWLFRRINTHHLLHHRYMNKNFNVVLPLADFVLGTLMLRAKTRFLQATGPSLLDVQPVDEALTKE